MGTCRRQEVSMAQPSGSPPGYRPTPLTTDEQARAEVTGG
jgi:hypothetical protein